MNVVAFDTETRGLDWFVPDHRAFLGSWANATTEDICRFDEDGGTEAFVEVLDAADVLIAHNLPFDTHHVREATGYDILKDSKAELWDTDLMSRVLLPEGQRAGERGGHGLKNLAKVYLGADSDEAENAIKDLAKKIGLRTLKRTGAYYEVWRAYPLALEHYAAQDARLTWDLFEFFSQKLVDDPKARRVLELEREVQPLLIRAEQRGVRVDPAKTKSLYMAELKRQKDLHAELVTELGEEAIGGAGSEDAMLEALQKIGVPLHRKTKTGKLAVNQYALQEFEDEFPPLKTLGEYRHASKLLSTYLEPSLGKEVVNPSFRQCGAWTGRMSCTRPNMQNIPKRKGKHLRSIFLPREGHKLLIVDYDAIEIRLLAHYMNDQGFKDLISGGFDPHAWMASEIWGGSPADYEKGGPRDHERGVAKNTLFAITYGAGAPRVSDMNKITKDEARNLIATIKSALPGFKRLQQRIRDKVEATGHVTTLFGRKQPVSRDKSYVGLNALIQGSAADIMKQGLVNASKILTVHPLLVVHDELVAEVPEERAAAALPSVQKALEAAWDLVPPLRTTGKIASNYAEADPDA